MKTARFFFTVLFILCVFSGHAVAWEKYSDDGFGEVFNIRVSVITGFNTQLYAGTFHRTQGGQLWRYEGATWTQVNSSGFGTRFNRQISCLRQFTTYLYAGTQNTNVSGGAEIYRSSDGTTWDPVVGGSSSVGAGFGDPDNAEVTDMEVYSGYLYAGVTINASASGKASSIYRSSDGTTWTLVPGTANGFGDPDNRGVSTLCVYSGKLYAGTYKGAGAGELWVYDGAVWTHVSDGFGDSENTDLTAMTEYMGDLFVGTRNETTGAEIWRYDGAVWTQANADGFGSGKTIRKTGSFAVSSTYILAGSYNQDDGCIVWGSLDGTNGSWFQSNVPGFGTMNNVDAQSLYYFSGYFYAGTTNTTEGGSVWRTDNPGSEKVPVSAIIICILFIFFSTAIKMRP